MCSHNFISSGSIGQSGLLNLKIASCWAQDCYRWQAHFWNLLFKCVSLEQQQQQATKTTMGGKWRWSRIFHVFFQFVWRWKQFKYHFQSIFVCASNLLFPSPWRSFTRVDENLHIFKWAQIYSNFSKALKMAAEREIGGKTYTQFTIHATFLFKVLSNAATV